MSHEKIIRIGLSDNNEYGKIMFCIRTYYGERPVAKKMKEDFDEALDLATKLADGDQNKVKVNIRAARRAKQIILEKSRAQSA